MRALLLCLLAMAALAGSANAGRKVDVGFSVNPRANRRLLDSPGTVTGTCYNYASGQRTLETTGHQEVNYDKPNVKYTVEAPTSSSLYGVTLATYCNVQLQLGGSSDDSFTLVACLTSAGLAASNSGDCACCELCLIQGGNSCKHWTYSSKCYTDDQGNSRCGVCRLWNGNGNMDRTSDSNWDSGDATQNVDGTLPNEITCPAPAASPPPAATNQPEAPTNFLPPGQMHSDPIFVGFNGQEYHFREVGDFTILEESDGWKLEATFVGSPVEKDDMVLETSWTASVRVISPTGDVVSCHLPTILPNTSLVQMTAMPSSSPDAVVEMSLAHPTVELGQMTGTAVVEVKSDANQARITGCQIDTPQMIIKVKQTYGWERMLVQPLEAWAEPFTWLDTDVVIVAPLAHPVTGILGDTYPKDAPMGTDQVALHPEDSTVATGSAATMEGIAVEAGTTHQRELASLAQRGLLRAGMRGLARHMY